MVELVELKEQPFVESSIETMDTAVFNYINTQLNLYTIRNGESEKFQIKKNKELRDNSETLIYPLITVYRESIEKAIDGFPFTPGSNSFAIARRIMPFNTRKFANATAKKRFKVSNAKFDNEKVVYETLYSENVTSVMAKYNILIRTTYLTDMNQILNGFLTANNYRDIKIENEGHFYYMTLPNQFSFDKVSETLEAGERYFDTSFIIETRGALFARPENINDAVLKTSQNAVSIKFNKERTMVGEVPTIRNGAKSFVDD